MSVLEDNMQMLQVTGFWIDRSKPSGLLFYIKKVLLLNTAVYFVFGIFGFPMYIYTHSDNFGEVSESLANLVTVSLPITIFIIFVLKNDELTELVQLLRNVDELYPPYDEYTKAVDAHTKKWCHFWSVTVQRAVFVSYGLMTSVPVVDLYKKRNLEQQLKFVFPFDVTDPGNFEVAFFGFIVSFYYAAAMSVGCYLIIICMFLNVRGHLKILNHKFGTLRSSAEAAVRDKRELGAESLTSIEGQQDAVENSSVDMGLVETHGSLEHLESRQDDMASADAGFDSLEDIEIQLNMEALLKGCVAHHCELLKFIRAFEKYWNLFFFVNVVVCLAHSVLVLTSTSMKSGNSSLLVHFAVMASFYSSLGVFCFLSQQVTAKSELLQKSIYGCGWTDASKSFKRSVGIMVSVTNQPIVIKASEFIPLSLFTFKTVINSAYQSYMVLRRF